MRILGIDPGSSATGFGLVERSAAGLRHLAHGVVRPPGKGSPEIRLQYLYRAICEIVAQHRPDVAAVEQVFVAASPRSALVLGQARGAILAALGSVGLPVTEYAATQIKLTVTGSGRAAKRQVQTNVRRVLELDRVPASDAADALAAAICHSHAGRLTLLGVRGRRRSSRSRGVPVRVRQSP